MIGVATDVSECAGNEFSVRGSNLATTRALILDTKLNVESECDRSSEHV